MSAKAGANLSKVWKRFQMFGYPTGLGALLVRNTSSGILEKNYFGGGTVDLALVRTNKQFHRQNLSQRLEDGTADYLGSKILTLRSDKPFLCNQMFF